MAVEVEIDVELLKREIKKTYASVSEEPEKDFIFSTGRAWAEDLDYPDELANVPEAAVESFAGVANPGRARGPAQQSPPGGDPGHHALRARRDDQGARRRCPARLPADGARPARRRRARGSRRREGCGSSRRRRRRRSGPPPAASWLTAPTAAPPSASRPRSPRRRRPTWPWRRSRRWQPPPSGRRSAPSDLPGADDGARA
jgi:hypothetical protein